MRPGVPSSDAWRWAGPPIGVPGWSSGRLRRSSLVSAKTRLGRYAGPPNGASARTCGSHPGASPCWPPSAEPLIGAPGFEPGTSATRTQRSTGLSHAPKTGLAFLRGLAAPNCSNHKGVGWARCASRVAGSSARRASRDPMLPRSARPTLPICCANRRVGSNSCLAAHQTGRGGIRTHAGVSPHDFQSCALSHSATRPVR